MIVTISGSAGSGKSTIAKIIAEKKNFAHYSVGDVLRKMAQEKGIGLIEMNKLAEKDTSIDKELDHRLIQLGMEKDDFVIDGRLTAFFIPHAEVRIFLDGRKEVRAQRILRADRDLESNTTLQDTVRNMEEREESEKKRYREYYDVDYLDPKLYTDVIDTTLLSVDEVVFEVLKIVDGKGA